MGLMLSRKKTKHLPPPGKQKNIKLKEYNRTKCTSYKYFDTNLHQNGGCEKEVDLRISKAWNKWRELTGVLCDKRIIAKLEVLIYKTVIKPTLLYGNETRPLTERLAEKGEFT